MNTDTKNTISEITNSKTLEEHMRKNVDEARELYNKAVQLKCLNEEFFMDWQDDLNEVTFVKEEDL